ncbi:lantibiotic dehydratase [Streptomyces sp. GS7]|uniref:lantibiotic dehydratase n=1 Tax=Streptomyces sp. GS7 TaxID=2692234 RepID=UPI001315D9AB|nr:lantibiotic dehydratase [Streptomyces sp. GS7]QHC26379.1 lantibiotic dehydratase [Streptomyces sp. GS7]
MYEYVDAAMLRAVAWPPGHQVRSWPDPTAGAASWRTWLKQTLRIPGFATALDQASPTLGHRVRDICGGKQLPEPAVWKAVLAVTRYLLRASSRATPFGLFAGVMPARIAEVPTVHIGAGHRAVAMPDAAWLTAVIERLEVESALLPRLTVQAHALVVEKEGHLILRHRGDGSLGGPPAHVRVRATIPVRSAMDAARQPIRAVSLASKLAADFPHVPSDVIDKLLVDLTAQRLLITNLRGPMTTTDPLGHLLDVLKAAEVEDITTVADIAAQLRQIADGLARHNTTSTRAREQRAQLTSAMQHLHPCSRPPLGVDLRLKGEVTIPHEVAAEAARAATALVRLARRPFLSRAWTRWHGRFLERYGPRALVPVLEAVDDTGLGYPEGFLGGPPAEANGSLTERDLKLLALAQNAALRRQGEIVLDDSMIADLAAAGPEMRVQPTTELTVRVHAASARDLEPGEFTLAVTGVSRTAGTVTGRFLHLLEPGDRERMTKAYAAAATATEGALPIQVSAPPLYVGAENVARAPLAMPAVLTLGECHEHTDNRRVLLEDVAVTADTHRLYLISQTMRRPLEFVTLNAVEPTHRTHPLVRFLTEANNSMSVPCTNFDWGAATSLPFLPALRYRRTILAPARWRLTADELADREADGAQWNRALTAWRDQVAAPSTIYAGDGDQRIRLDLTEPAHRALLRAQVQRDGVAVLRAETAPDAGWVDGRAHELVIPLAFNGEPGPAPQWLDSGKTVGREHGHLPGCDGRFLVKLYGHPDHYGSILTRFLPHLLTELGSTVRWWFLPYSDPNDHLRLRLIVPTDRAASTPGAIGAWTQRLRQAGLISRVQWDTDFPETARFGGVQAIDAAEAYFAADSKAAAAQITYSSTKGGPDARALTAASMLDLTTSLIGNPAEAMSWLIDHAQTTSTPPARDLYDQAVTLGNPNDRCDLARQPDGEQILARWAQRRETLAAYKAVLDTAGTASATALLPELLHLHHTRIAGLDLKAEGQCLHLARAAALSWTARGRSGS